MVKMVNIESVDILLIGVFLGQNKPSCVDNFLHDIIIEVKDLLNTGYPVLNKGLSFKIKVFICDTPARAFSCGIKGHNSFQ